MAPNALIFGLNPEVVQLVETTLVELGYWTDTMESISDFQPARANDYDIIIFETKDLCTRKLELAANLRKLGCKTDIMFIAEQITIGAYRKIALLKNTITMQKPFSQRELRDVFKNRNNVRDSVKRRPRFYTNQDVKVIALKSGLFIPTMMRNYSEGGAFLEYKGISLKVGDLLQMNIASQNELADSLSVKAKVVWIKDSEGRGRLGRGIGVQFLSDLSA